LKGRVVAPQNIDLIGCPTISFGSCHAEAEKNAAEDTQVLAFSSGIGNAGVPFIAYHDLACNL
jgi:hypothetical protein